MFSIAEKCVEMAFAIENAIEESDICRKLCLPLS